MYVCVKKLFVYYSPWLYCYLRTSILVPFLSGLKACYLCESMFDTMSDILLTMLCSNEIAF